MARKLVAGLFDRDGVTAIDEQARHQVDRLLRSIHDEHLLGVGTDAARASEIRRNGPTQWKVAFGWSVPQHAQRKMSGLLRDEPAPNRIREIRNGRSAVVEVIERGR